MVPHEEAPDSSAKRDTAAGDTADLNREEVTLRRQRLLDEYDDVHVQEEREVVDDETFAELRALCEGGYTGGGYAWVVRDPEQKRDLTESMPDGIDEQRAVLMIQNRASHRWGLPGGGREPGETYEEAARREVREETGIECTLEECFLVRERTIGSEGDRDGRLHTLWVFFDGRYADGHIEIQPGELDGAAWLDRPPKRLLPENQFRAARFWDDYEADDPLAELRDVGPDE